MVSKSNEVDSEAGGKCKVFEVAVAGSSPSGITTTLFCAKLVLQTANNKLTISRVE